jgi:hypothetical protein
MFSEIMAHMEAYGFREVAVIPAGQHAALRKVAEAAGRVAAFDWGTSTTETYHDARIGELNSLRAELDALKKVEGCNE